MEHTNDEGVIKFTYSWMRKDAIPGEAFEEINPWRQKLYTLGYIGQYPNGIGYGNISLRIDHHSFLISGSGTGAKTELSMADYALVTEYDIERNHLTCAGLTRASSESLTHAAIYELSEEIKVVMHIHHQEMWRRLMGKVPTTREGVSYGTLEMANEMKRLAQESTLLQKRILVMAGHVEGIITFGHSLPEAYQVLNTIF